MGVLWVKVNHGASVADAGMLTIKASPPLRSADRCQHEGHKVRALLRASNGDAGTAGSTSNVELWAGRSRVIATTARGSIFP